MENDSTQKKLRNTALDVKAIKNMLIIIIIPLVFYLLKLLAFIFIPLASALFLSILFTPFMRWMKKKKIPKIVSLFSVMLIIFSFFKLSSELVQLSSHEIMNSNTSELLIKMEDKLLGVVRPVEQFLGIGTAIEDDSIHNFLQGDDGNSSLLNYFGNTIQFLQKFITQLLMLFFFLILLLAGSLDLQSIMNSTVVKRRSTAIKTMLKIEKSIVKFIQVKFILSALTGIGFGLACVAFDVSFPIFWGLFAFAINFVQMVGSVISNLCLSIFSLAEIESTGTLALFCIIIASVQILFGGILEPIMMGKTFSINTVTVLIMLMLWGFVWGVPGLILSIPITVLVKIILEQNSRTKNIAKLMA